MLEKHMKELKAGVAENGIWRFTNSLPAITKNDCEELLALLEELQQWRMFVEESKKNRDFILKRMNNFSKGEPEYDMFYERYYVLQSIVSFAEKLSGAKKE